MKDCGNHRTCCPASTEDDQKRAAVCTTRAGSSLEHTPPRIESSQPDKRQADPQAACSKQIDRMFPPTPQRNTPPGPRQTAFSAGFTAENALAELSDRIRAGAVLWITVASLQVLCGLWLIMTGANISHGYYSEVSGAGSANILAGLVLLAVATSNFVTAFRDFRYSRDILSNPTGIVEKFLPLSGRIANLMLNFLLGCVIGAVGSVFCLFTRGFVIRRRLVFRAIEADFRAHRVSASEKQ